MRYLDVITTARRYARSINLERDLADSAALDGYVLTPRGRETLAMFQDRSEKENAVRAFTVTAVYGAGKSAFMHFLLSLLGPEKSSPRNRALEILKNQKIRGDVFRFFDGLHKSQPAFVRAVTISRSESITMTLARALLAGTAGAKGLTERDVHATAEIYLERAQKGKPMPATALVDAVMLLANARPIIIAIDELGKNLEQVAVGENDVYLLQMLAELPRQKYPVFFFGLLHSAFADYGGRLGSKEKAEWAKVQGRFEDIPFMDSNESTLSLIAAAIEQKGTVKRIAERIGSAWQKELPVVGESWARLFPLHPLAARAIPLLCARYGQNERSLFNYLTGHELHSFHNFLEHETLDEKQPKLLKLCHLYDYFIEEATLSTGERSSRLVELRDRIHANAHLDSDLTDILKTIAVLNAVSSGPLKAAHFTVIQAMAEMPNTREKETKKALAELVAKRIITYRNQADEYRLWAGSEVDVEQLIKLELDKVPANLAGTLNADFRLRTIVASRHSFETGTLRYFSALFIDEGRVGQDIPNADGYVLYDISQNKTIGKHGQKNNLSAPVLFNHTEIESSLPNNLPIVCVASNKVNALRILAREVLALKSLMAGKSAWSLDAIAKREVIERYHIMADRLREMIQREFTSIGRGTKISCIPNISDETGTLGQIASRLCDTVYSSGFVLKNELINRQALSSQIAKARGEIVGLMLKYGDEAGQHFNGNGPEVSIYRTLVGKEYRAGLKPARKAIEAFATSAKEARPLADLFALLQQPPYGIRLGIMPLLLVEYLLHNEESVSLYQDGSFIPEITTETLDILVRRPEKFSLKRFVVSGLESRYFDELVKMYASNSQTKKSSLLTVIKPLIRFSRNLPRYTQQTRHISEKSQRLRSVLLNAREPDRLIFVEIPQALGIELRGKAGEGSTVKSLTKALTQALHELQNAYPKLLDECRSAFVTSLRIPEATEARSYLTSMAGLLSGSVLDPVLKRFMNAVGEKHKPDTEWLEGIIMVVADKPAESWRDDDKNTFDINLATLAQKFLNLHHLAAKVQAAGNGKFEARLISITSPAGSEAREVVWSDAAEQKQVQALKEYLDTVETWKKASTRVQQAALVEMLESLLPGAHQFEPAMIKIERTPKGKRHG